MTKKIKQDTKVSNQNKKNNIKILLILVLTAIIIFIVILFFPREEKIFSDIVILFFPREEKISSEKVDEFAKCLTSNGAVMYGAFWCPHCAKTKKRFGNSFRYIEYIECDPRGDNAQPGLCQENGIRGYPTWIMNDTIRYEGVQSLEDLADYSGCLLNS